ERSREPETEAWVPAGPPKDRRDGKKIVKLPETPKTAEEMWQHSVIGDYLAKYRVSPRATSCSDIQGSLWGPVLSCFWSCPTLQSDRRKAQVAMEAAWRSMEKKEKIPWIKKAAEDQKRYEVQTLTHRSGYQMFSQELLTNGELNHFSLKERMVEIGKRWQKLSQTQKDKYKKLVEEQQVEYKAELETWVKSASVQICFLEGGGFLGLRLAFILPAVSWLEICFCLAETPQHLKSHQQPGGQSPRNGEGEGRRFESGNSRGQRGKKGHGLPRQGNTTPNLMNP
ncbi:hypothetical protein GOODEAATRI_016144, partial [Goodea atripinnis]